MTRSTPSMSSLGKMLPQSTTTMSSSYSKTVMFLPISSTPPRLTIRRRLAGCAAFVLGVIPSLSFKRFRFFSFTYFHHGSKKAIFSENCCWRRQACVSPNPISIISMPGKTHFIRCALQPKTARAGLPCPCPLSQHFPVVCQTLPIPSPQDGHCKPSTGDFLFFIPQFRLPQHHHSGMAAFDCGLFCNAQTPRSYSIAHIQKKSTGI